MVALATLLTAVAVALPIPAFAHAVLLSSEPATNAVVATGPLRVRLQFSSRVDAARSRVMLLAPDGAETKLAFAHDMPPGMLAGLARVDRAGGWTLQWQVLSVDGHVTRGDVRFSVRAP